ncbi:hypothetical protein [Streptomyces scabiei]|uniref:hypothetical protein n=1 Tax=Streptomyces scabiei TaxID=1930 RepID=UPI0029A93500|nr:hypothetical protein [Streptomyces scabiei]MDX3524037.1 hypothetical protein [Streptomyces scabiei]
MTHKEEQELDPKEQFLFTVTYLGGEFWRKMDALLEVANVASPQVRKLDSDFIPSVMNPVLESLSEEEFNKIGEVFDRYEKEAKEGQNTNIMSIMWEAVKDYSWGPAWMHHFNDALSRPPRLPIFFQSAVVSAVSNFEVLLAGLVSNFYEIAPQALEASSRDKGKEFSLRELKEMKNLEDAIKIAIDRRVDEFMFGSFNDWRKFFADKMNLNFEDYAIDWSFLREIFQRRHVIVHNGGHASRRYMQSVDAGLREGVKEGHYLEVDENYLHQAVSELLCFGYMLMTAVAMKFASGLSEKVISDVHVFTYKNLVKGRYELVKKCASYGIQASSSMDDELLFRVNSWISRQRMGDEAVLQEVKGWDVAALSPRYVLAKHCLLGENVEAMQVLRGLAGSGDVDFGGLIEWPLLEPLRGTKEYQELVRNAEVPEDWGFAEQVLFENPKTAVLHTRRCTLVRADFKRRSIGQIDLTSASLCKRCKPSTALGDDE